jgi:hypothetical protein
VYIRLGVVELAVASIAIKEISFGCTSTCNLLSDLTKQFIDIKSNK